ncbi:hypothetical protein CARUB_v10027188mg [Capsella rubella]|uniref:DUF4408 domain-containing protein n=1 Tax=Capsella rubella TaxID=81985 RepID=R0EXS5_9BRAS|nr:uncharacterized protein LOC17876150 [Capsella rubella]EOA14052.1 hypothetical protein CARUB_v10027188mg [Capsella rubella]
MKKATALMKHIVAMLSSVAKAKSIAIKNKTSAFKTRVLMLSLVKHKKLGFRSISNKIHNLLGHADQDQDHDVNDQDQDKTKAIVLYSSKAASTMAHHHEEYDVHEDNDKYPDLRHTLFEGDDDFGDLEEEGQGSSVIDMVRNSKEEEGENFKLEDEIDHVADLFISRFHKQMKLQKLLSFKRYQEMLARGT